MVDSDAVTGNEGPGLFPQSVGERLRAARIKAGLDLNDIATRTRVPMRHLEAIERADFDSLPSITYALGFARAYARAVDDDEAEIARNLRIELGRAPIDPLEVAPYEPVDPARVPSRLLAWTAAAIAVLLAFGWWALRSDMFGGNDNIAAIEAAPVAETPAPATAPVSDIVAPPVVTGQVVLTATSPVWLRIYDRADKVLLEKELAAGESWTVPADADTPMIRTGRADMLKVTIDGREVAPLGPPEKTIRDVVLSAAALGARPVDGLPRP
jgi:cytoskeleton protein RodZ